MGLFSRKPAPTVIATGAEIDVAAKALAAGNDTLANQLCDRAGSDRQRVAMAILGRSLDYAPQD
ncbi:hypothetical protein [Streptomyces sp. SCL15-4]|uniref:hypothetical protein n=1 Tax=Streptomyces sp. SCL15-4 TaxID=2967221 RepID=UPI002966355E|nr:hypothetical protein [Streptomyces sp. SCL15-4]